MTLVLGIDPGIRGGGGAMVALNDGAAPQLIDAIDVPVIGTVIDPAAELPVHS